MLRSVLLYLSEREGLRDFLMGQRFARRVAHRFVAGESLDDAIAVVRELNARNMSATLDYLGESVTAPQEAERAAQGYVAILERLRREGVDCGVSIKLTQIGLAIGEALCRRNLRRVADAGRRYDTFVRIDMESSEYVEPTLRLFRELFPEFDNLGVVLQSYLRDSERHARDLCAWGAPVRLCKGAYRAARRIAYQSKREVNKSFIDVMRVLHGCDVPLAVATHDTAIIEEARRLRREHPDRMAHFEFQMLYGVRRSLQERLVREGYPMRIYVPFGTEWYPYFMRRMAERPANAWFVVRAMLGR